MSKHKISGRVDIFTFLLIMAINAILKSFDSILYLIIKLSLYLTKIQVMILK
jgi:hypothetical protein